MKLAFICAPYRAEDHNEVHENIQRARSMAIALWKRGYAVICPHLNSAFMSGAVEEGVFLEGAREMLRRCGLVIYTGESAGVRLEIALAFELDMPVYRYDEFIATGERG